MPYKDKIVQTLMRALHKSIQHTCTCQICGSGGASHNCVFSTPPPTRAAWEQSCGPRCIPTRFWLQIRWL